MPPPSRLSHRVTLPDGSVFVSNKSQRPPYLHGATIGCPCSGRECRIHCIGPCPSRAVWLPGQNRRNRCNAAWIGVWTGILVHFFYCHGAPQERESVLYKIGKRAKDSTMVSVVQGVPALIVPGIETLESLVNVEWTEAHGLESE